MKKTSVGVTVALLTLAAAASVSASVISNEPCTAADFGDVGTNLLGKGGGTGWNGTWGPGQTSSYLVGPGLTYGGPATWPSCERSVNSNYTGSNYGRRIVPDASTSGTTGINGTTVWFSCLIQPHATMAAGAGARIMFMTNSSGSGFGIEIDSTNGFRARGQGGLGNGSGTLTTDHVYLVIGKVAFGATNDTVSLWVDPANPTSEANLGTASSTLTTTTKIAFPGPTALNNYFLWCRNITNGAADIYYAGNFQIGNFPGDVGVPVSLSGFSIE